MSLINRATAIEIISRARMADYVRFPGYYYTGGGSGKALRGPRNRPAIAFKGQSTNGAR